MDVVPSGAELDRLEKRGRVRDSGFVVEVATVRAMRESIYGFEFFAQ